MNPGADAARTVEVRLTVISNLAYFHADLVGSHEGDRRDSMKLARRFMDEVKANYVAQDFPPEGLNSSDEEIRAAVSVANPTKAWRVFFVLDSEAYVGIQCAEDEAELRAIRKRLDFLHNHPPAGDGNLARMSVDYHDYCARVRLSELERVLGR